MIINHNLSAMTTHRYLKINSFNINQNIRKLSSGLRITRGGDDASGLAVSEKMRAQVRGLNQASRNAQDGISMIQTAEGWLSETTSILQRMRELAVQSANGTYTSEDRLQIQVEINQLVDEIDRISDHAEFNTLRLLRGGFRREGGEKAPAAVGDASKNSPMLIIPDVVADADANPNDVLEKGGGIYFHIGANTDQREKVYIGNMSAGALGLTKLPPLYLNQDGSNSAILKVDSALKLVNRQRADLGGFQSRLEHTIRGVDMAAENIQHAESQIRDLDMAKEMVDFVKNQILSQATATMLAQANLRPQIVLRVLG